MKMFKYIFFAGAVCTAAFLAGCNEDEYTPGEASSENGLNVYLEFTDRSRSRPWA